MARDNFSPPWNTKVLRPGAEHWTTVEKRQLEEICYHKSYNVILCILSAVANNEDPNTVLGEYFDLIYFIEK